MSNEQEVHGHAPGGADSGGQSGGTAANATAPKDSWARTAALVVVVVGLTLAVQRWVLPAIGIGGG